MQVEHHHHQPKLQITNNNNNNNSDNNNDTETSNIINRKKLSFLNITINWHVLHLMHGERHAINTFNTL